MSVGMVLLGARHAALATYHGYYWQKTSETPCNPECGQSGATHEVTYTCVDGEGSEHDECSIQTVYDSCPEGFAVAIDSHKCYNKKNWFNLITRPSHKVPETKTVTEDCEVPEEEVIACKPEEPVCEEGYYMTENGCELNRVPENKQSEPSHEPSAPTLPQCPTIEGWLPQIAFHTEDTTHNTDGTWTFHYTIKSVSESNPVWWIWYGPTPTLLPQVTVVEGTDVKITQEWSHNYIKAALFRQPGCFGKWSEVVN